MRTIRKIINKDHYLAAYHIKEFPEVVVVSKSPLQESDDFTALTFDPNLTKDFLLSQHGTIKATVLYNFLQGIVNGRNYQELLEWSSELLEGNFLSVSEVDKASLYGLLLDGGVPESEIENHIGPLNGGISTLHGVDIIFPEGADNHERDEYRSVLENLYDRLKDHAPALFSGTITISDETRYREEDQLLTISSHDIMSGSALEKILPVFGEKFYHELDSEEQHAIDVMMPIVNAAITGEKVTYGGNEEVFRSASPYTIQSITPQKAILSPVSGVVVRDGKSYREMAIRTQALLNGNWKANGDKTQSNDHPVEVWAGIFTSYVMDELDAGLMEMMRDIVEKRHVDFG